MSADGVMLVGPVATRRTVHRCTPPGPPSTGATAVRATPPRLDTADMGTLPAGIAQVGSLWQCACGTYWHAEKERPWSDYVRWVVVSPKWAAKYLARARRGEVDCCT